MTGVVRRNSSRTMFITRDGQLVMKAPGNIDQTGSQANDWIEGPIGTNVLADWAKYQGGDKQTFANYDAPSYVERDNFPDV